MSMMYDIDGAAELIMAEMASERIFEEIQNILQNDKSRSEKDARFKELHFLIDGTGTTDPKGWVKKALMDFDAQKASGWDVPANASPLIKCLWVKKYRKELQKLRKANGGKMPNEEQIRKYYENLDVEKMLRKQS